MYCYRAYGLGIHSEFSIFDLPVQEAAQDVAIIREELEAVRGEGEAPYPYIRLNGQEAIYTLEGLGCFRVSGGRQISVDPHPDADRGDLVSSLVGNALALLLYQRKRLLLHASVVSINRTGVAFLGDSGAGKSSIAAAFLANGHKLLVDDLASIDINAGNAWIYPGFPYIKLSNDALSMLSPNPERLVFKDKIDDKGIYLLDDFANGDRVPLSQIYVIRSGAEVILKQLNSQRALFELMRYSIPPSMVKQNHAVHFRRCLELLKNILVYGLERPESLDQLSYLVTKVEKNATS